MKIGLKCSVKGGLRIKSAVERDLGDCPICAKQKLAGFFYSKGVHIGREVHS